MMTLGLTEELEGNIRGIATKTMDSVESVFGRVAVIEMQFDKVQERFKTIFKD